MSWYEASQQLNNTYPKPWIREPSTDGDTGTKVKLSKLMIQPFRGELTTWNTFWDCYDAAIHSNRLLSDIEKFNYLRSLVQGPALDAITGLALTATNYQEAIELLQGRFGKKQRIIDKHMEVLFGTKISNLHQYEGLFLWSKLVQVQFPPVVLPIS